MIPNCETDNCINGTCDSSDGECDCVAGYEGSLCQHNIDDCAKMPCEHSGTCTDELNDYQCQCPTGYDGLSIFIMPPKIQLCFGVILQY
jgi:Notch-like protein